MGRARLVEPERAWSQVPEPDGLIAARLPRLSPMHRSAYKKMRRLVDQFVPTDRRLRVVDLGSGTNPNQHAAGMTHAALFDDYNAEVIGVDVVKAPNVDVVLTKPYRLPFRSNSVDVVISGQVFEHIPFFWASVLEVARVLKPGGLFLMTVPSRGHKHMIVDCWRYYDDGVRAMAAFSGLAVRRAETEFPKRHPGRVFTVESHANREGYWGDTVGVLQKPVRYPTRRMLLIRGPVVWWANKTARVFGDSVKAAQRGKRREVVTKAGQAIKKV